MSKFSPHRIQEVSSALDKLAGTNSEPTAVQFQDRNDGEIRLIFEQEEADE